MTAVVALRDVRRDHATGFTLEVPALDVLAGEVLAVIGPNGSGKSTLLRLLGLLERPQAGQVLVGGRPVDARDALPERRRMATVFQEPLLADTSVAANVALGLRFRGVAGAEVERRVSRWLARLGVGALAARAARTLSGGEAQRVALARALVLEPEVLLLDEPFASLDQPSRTALIGDLGAILREDRITTVIVTHHRGEAQALADRVAVLLGGRLCQLDETARVFQAPASEDVARFVGVETIVTGRVLGREAGVTRVEVAGRILEVAAPVDTGVWVRVAIRPEDVRVQGVTGSEENVVLAHIKAMEFLGSFFRVDLAGDALDGVTLRADLAVDLVRRLGLAEGQSLTVLLPRRRLRVYPGPAALA